jgi:hypothetical protein
MPSGKAINKVIGRLSWGDFLGTTFLSQLSRLRFLAKLIVQTESGHPLGAVRKAVCKISGVRLLLYEYEAIPALKLP